MTYVLDITTTDNYQYLECPGTTSVTIQVSNAAAAVGVGQAASRGLTFQKGSATYPPVDEPILPSVGGLTRECDEIRVKSYAHGIPANVKVVAR